MQLFDALGEFFEATVEEVGGVLEGVTPVMDELVCARAGGGFDAAYAGGDALFGEDTEVSDVACLADVSSAAEFEARAEADHADVFAVFFIEECHGSGMLCFFKGDKAYIGGVILADQFIDVIFDKLEVFWGEWFVVGVVKAEAIWGDEGARLFDVISEVLA